MTRSRQKKQAIAALGGDVQDRQPVAAAPSPASTEPSSDERRRFMRSLVRGFAFLPALVNDGAAAVAPDRSLPVEFGQWAAHQGLAIPDALIDALGPPRGTAALTWDADALTPTSGHAHVLIGAEEVSPGAADDSAPGPADVSPGDLTWYFSQLLSRPPFERPVMAEAPSLYYFQDPVLDVPTPGTVLGATWHHEDGTEWIVLVEAPASRVEGLEGRTAAAVRIIRPEKQPTADVDGDAAQVP